VNSAINPDTALRDGPILSREALMSRKPGNRTRFRRVFTAIRLLLWRKFDDLKPVFLESLEDIDQRFEGNWFNDVGVDAQIV